MPVPPTQHLQPLIIVWQQFLPYTTAFFLGRTRNYIVTVCLFAVLTLWMQRFRQMSTTKLNPRNFPRPPLCERTNRHLEVKWKGTTIAETKEAYWVLETYHPPTYYLPPDAFKIPLEKTSKSSYCEWKGMATYYTVKATDGSKDVISNRIWSYDNPTKSFESIKGYLSLYAGPWDCYVDGEQVQAQPGDFYGGWMTSDIEQSSVKGGPGTWGW